METPHFRVTLPAVVLSDRFHSLAHAKAATSLLRCGQLPSTAALKVCPVGLREISTRNKRQKQELN